MFPNTLPKHAQDALAVLGKSKVLDFAFMAGGSALALQLGHRRSVDFDFFSSSGFEPNKITTALKKIGHLEISQQTSDTLLGSFNSIKFSLFKYPYLNIKQTVGFQNINIASCEDIAAMKLAAITGRGTKKDYIDLYFLVTEKFGFEEMLGFYQEKFNLLEENKLVIIKSLQYFVDADETEMPFMIKNVSWEDVKKLLQAEALRLWQEIAK